MDINAAVETIEAFLASYESDHDDWSTTEIRVLPSGDDRDAIKITINFGPDADEGAIEGLKDRAVAALEGAHADIAGAFRLDVRALAD